MEIDNIERFYEYNHQCLIEENGRRPLRPTKSYTKDIIACFNKFKELYIREGIVDHSKEEISSILEVDTNTTLQNMRSMQEFGFLTGMVGNSDDDDDSQNTTTTNDVFRLTPSFSQFVESNENFGFFLYNKLISIRTLNDFTPYLNLLLCTLREAALFNEAISFGSIGDDTFKSKVSDSAIRQNYRSRIYDIYGYSGRRGQNHSVNSDDYVPNISYMSLGSLEDLGLIKKNKNKNEHNFITYSLTYSGTYLLYVINKKIQKYSLSQQIDMKHLQVIFYGSPGTGKSNEIKQLTGEGKDGIKFSKDFTFRTTFHPDSDYSSFVGAYKPIWNGEKIIYDFRPQSFLKAYVAAWTHPSESVALVIEEINRGNCAQIFGDIFQLLDRESNGLSKYPIEADIDMQTYLKSKFEQIDEHYELAQISAINKYYIEHYDVAFQDIKNGKILTLPVNLSILSTMNTSDQSLFPMDSAFKRRWEWKYQPIVNAGKNWKIELSPDYEPIDWWEFLTRINRVVSDLTTSEDKQLGYFFCLPDKANDSIISDKRFVEKVIFYLWNDVFKDYAFDANCCKDKDGKEVLFAKFFNGDGETVNTEVLKQFFETLKNDKEESLVKKKEESNANDQSAETPTVADGTNTTEEESTIEDTTE